MLHNRDFNAIKEIGEQQKEIVKALEAMAKTLAECFKIQEEKKDVKAKDLDKKFDGLIEALNGLKVAPTVVTSAKKSTAKK